ncbi:MAG: glycosyltransferase [Candidatus Levybacteria bacterium]|nr:glycosyltransferase [Candidatus Levybacteria bacterium]
MNKIDLSNKKVAIVSHIYATGPTHALEEYLVKKTKKLIFIGHPFVFAKDTRSHMRVYNDSKKKSVNTFLPLKLQSQFLSLVKDTIVTMYWIMKNGPLDVYIGADCFNGAVGVFLKKVGLVKKTIFWTIDYIPNRFPNKFMNKIYHSLDTYCVKESDMVWNLSQVMVTEREKKGVAKKYRGKQIVVPMGTEGNIISVPFSKIKRYTAIHMGHLIPKQGVQLIIEAMPDILKKVPKFHLEIIGSGSYEDELKKLADSYKVSKHITWHGFVKSHTEVEKMISYGAFGLAPYVNTKDNYIQFTDPGKVKAYLAADLPIIITKMTQIAYEINDRVCGLAINYDKKEFVNASVTLLTDDNLLKQMKKNVVIMSKDYSWESIFSSALQRTL